MKTQLPAILLLMFAMIAGDVCAKNIETVTHIEVKYRRAFHEEIHIFIRRLGPDELVLTATALGPEGKIIKNPKLTVVGKRVRVRDLDLLMAFTNDPQMRKAFRDSEIDMRPDGSTLELLVFQNGFCIGFVSQDVFTRSSGVQHKRLRAVVEMLFTLGGLIIEKDNLY